MALTKATSISRDRLRSVLTFDALRGRVPDYPGEEVYLLSHSGRGSIGCGFFVAVMSNGVDDGGHVCVPTGTTGVHWRRVADTVQLSDYGIYSQGLNDSNLVDMHSALQAAIDRAVSDEMVLVTNMPNENHYVRRGVYLTKGVSITGLKTLEGCLPLIVDSSQFEGIPAVGYPGVTWVLTNMNATYGSTGMIFGTSVGNQSLGSIVIRDRSPRTNKLGAQLHTFSGTVISGALCATGFRGPGVYLSSCYDSSIQDIRSISCGDTQHWGVSFESYPKDDTSSLDTSNHLTIGSVEAHDCIDRAINQNSSSSSISHIHEEATVVTDTSTWSSATIASNGFGWTNTILAGAWANYGSVRILPSAGSADNYVATVVSDQVSIGSLNVEGNVSVHFTYTTPKRGINIGTLDVTKNLYVTTEVFGTINQCLVRGESSVVTQQSLELNFGILNTTGASSNIVASGCYDKLFGKTATLNKANLSGGSFTNLECTGGCSITSVGATSLLVSGSRNNIKDVYISGTSSFTGDGEVSSSSLVGASTFNGNYNISGVRTNAAMSVSNTQTPNFPTTLRDCNVNGQLNISGYSKVKLDNVVCSTLNINLTSGFLLMDDVQLSGALSGNAVSATNNPAAGSMTKDPSNGKVYVYKAGAWKEVTVAA